MLKSFLTVPLPCLSLHYQVVLEHFGKCGSGLSELELGRRSRDVEGHKNEADFRGFWRKKFSVILQRCNAKVSCLTSCPKLMRTFTIETFRIACIR